MTSDLTNLPTFAKDGAVHVVVETPRGSGVKLKYEPELGLFTISRPLVLGVTYPHDWGFIPRTRAPDGDPLDAMVLYDGSTFPGFLLRCRPIGLVKIEEKKKKGGGKERNDRVILVPADYPRCDHLRTFDDLPKRTRQELEEFFALAVVMTKPIRKLGWDGARVAERTIKRLAIR